MKITNLHGISLPLAIWLLHDEYDYVSDPNYISATTLLRSTKQIILSKRVAAQDREADVSEFIARAFGHATHDSIEKAWHKTARTSMVRLGYPEHVAERIVVNPSDEHLEAHPDCIPVWIEKRAKKEINGFVIGGKLDMAMDGRLFDTKTTSVYSYILGGKDDDYSLQGSIYRWLNPEIITDDHVYIQFIFTDWKKSDYRQQKDKGYPPIKVVEHPVMMHSIEDTERFIVAKTSEVRRLWNAPEEQLPACTPKELWQTDPNFKYYADPAKANDPNARSTKNFDNLSDANAHRAAQGKGVVKTIPGEVKACAYCPAFDACKQKDAYGFEP